MLYADYRWNTTAAELVSQGYDQYSEGYDGYTYFQQMAWFGLSQPGEARGLFTEVPGKGYSGWICYIEDNNFKDPIYSCESRFIPTF